MTFKLLTFPAKQIRARVIADYMRQSGTIGCVCFSSGNASLAMKEQLGIDVLDISPTGDLRTNGDWWTPQRIARTFPHRFDATPGHLPMPLMVQIAEAFKQRLGLPDIEDTCPPYYDVPTGSGETLVCLKIAYPNLAFRAIYNLDLATKYRPLAPLNVFVKAMASDVVFADWQSIVPFPVIKQSSGNLNTLSNRLNDLAQDSNR